MYVVKKMKLALVEWEDIVGHPREELPSEEEDLVNLMLIMETVGYIQEYRDHLIVVSDYDVTNDGKDYCHNTFTLIPRGVVRKVTYLAASSLDDLERDHVETGRDRGTIGHATQVIETKRE